MNLVIVGNPENRRVLLFQEALARAGHPPAHVIRWLDLARGDAPAFVGSPSIVRIESFGEDFEVTRALLHRGEEDARAAGVWCVAPEEIAPDHGRILAPRQEHFGFLRVLAELESWLRAQQVERVYPAPESIRRLFDKRACARTFADAGAPIAKPLPVVTTLDELHEAMADAAVARVFVKLTCGSSASCLALYDVRERWLFTSMEIAGANLYNSLRPRRYRAPRDIDRLLAFLLREGSHVEEHVPKARSEGQFFDTRMLVVDGEVPFTVMRKSPHPITNLHLGGVRGTQAELERCLPPQVLEEAKASAVRVSAAHACLHLGVDVMFTPEGRHVVLEANAFGDLLPNLTTEGLGVYDWEIRALRKRC